MANNLCYHIESLFYSQMNNRSKRRAMKEFIARSNDLITKNPSLASKYFKEIGRAITLFLSGIQGIKSQSFDHLALADNNQRLKYRLASGDFYIPDQVFKNRFLNLIMQDLTGFDTVLHLRALVAMTKISSIIKARELSHSEEQEIVDRIDRPLSIDETREIDKVSIEFRQICRSFIKHIIEKYGMPENKYFPITDLGDSPQKVFFIPWLQKTIKRKLSNTPIYSVKRAMEIPSINKLANTYQKEFIEMVLTGKPIDTTLPFNLEIPPVGRDQPLLFIGLIPEYGPKWRVPAVLSPILFSLGYNLFTKLTFINKHWSIQGVYGQQECCKYIQGLITDKYNGKTHFGIRDYDFSFESIDMSSFTDRFPYRLQRILLESLVEFEFIQQVDLEVMDLITNSTCFFKGKQQGKAPKYIKYHAGTPMGTHPSFPLASLCNGLVASLAFIRTYKLPIDHLDWDRLPFRIVGDDIVLFSIDTANEYRSVMNSIGVQTSLNKCISSEYIAEFCSCLITRFDVFEMRKLKPILFDSGSIKTNYEFYSKFLNQEHFLDDNPDYQPIKDFNNLVDILSTVPGPIGLGRQIYDENLNLIVPIDTLSNIEAEFYASRVLREISEYYYKFPEIQELFILLSRNKEELFPKFSCTILSNDNRLTPQNSLMNSLKEEHREISDSVKTGSYASAMELTEKTLCLRRKLCKLSLFDRIYDLHKSHNLSIINSINDDLQVWLNETDDPGNYNASLSRREISEDSLFTKIMRARLAIGMKFIL